MINQELDNGETLTKLLNNFQTINLESLNGKAELMSRKDNKYVLNIDQLEKLLKHTLPTYDLLNIDSESIFDYRSIYFDTEEFHTYQDHNKGRRKRIKVRFRNYVGADLYFFEIKIKGLRNETNKFRIKITKNEYELNKLSEKLLDFYNQTINSNYKEYFKYELKKSLIVDYKRITLVSQDTEERITIDNNIIFFDQDIKQVLNNNKYIVEIKSRNGSSTVDKWLFKNSIRPSPKCSKYCMGLSLLKLQNKNNYFKPIIRKKFHHGQ